MTPTDQEGPAPNATDSEWDRKRQAILAGAAAVFAGQGFAGGTTKDIAQRVGLSQPSIYHYVGSKTDLIAEIAKEVDRRFSAPLETALASAESPVEQLQAVVIGFVAAVAENLDAWTVYWEEGRSIPPAVAEDVQRSKARYIAGVDDIVRRCQADGALPAGRPTRVITEGILGTISSMYRWYRPDGRYNPAEIAATFLELLGLAPGDAAQADAPSIRSTRSP